MMYFVTFVAGMGFAYALDLVVVRYLQRKARLSLDIETGVREVFAVDPTSTKVGKKQMAKLRKEMGI